MHCSALNSLASSCSKKKKKTDKEENEILEYDSLAEMKKQMGHFQTTRLEVMMAAFHLKNKRLLLSWKIFPLQKKYSLHSRITFSQFFFIFRVVEPMGLLSDFVVLLIHLLTLLFVSLILTCLY